MVSYFGYYCDAHPFSSYDLFWIHPNKMKTLQFRSILSCLVLTMSIHLSHASHTLCVTLYVLNKCMTDSSPSKHTCSLSPHLSQILLCRQPIHHSYPNANRDALMLHNSPKTSLLSLLGSRSCKHIWPNTHSYPHLSITNNPGSPSSTGLLIGNNY